MELGAQLQQLLHVVPDQRFFLRRGEKVSFWYCNFGLRHTEHTVQAGQEGYIAELLHMATANQRERANT